MKPEGPGKHCLLWRQCGATGPEARGPGSVTVFSPELGIQTCFALSLQSAHWKDLSQTISFLMGNFKDTPKIFLEYFQPVCLQTGRDDVVFFVFFFGWSLLIAFQRAKLFKSHCYFIYLSRKGSGWGAHILDHLESKLCNCIVLRPVYLTESVYPCEGRKFGITQNRRPTWTWGRGGGRIAPLPDTPGGRGSAGLPWRAAFHLPSQERTCPLHF